MKVKSTWKITIIKALYYKNPVLISFFDRLQLFGKYKLLLTILLKNENEMINSFHSYSPKDFKGSEIYYMSNIIKGPSFNDSNFLTFHSQFCDWLFSYYSEIIEGFLKVHQIANHLKDYEVLNYRGKASLALFKIKTENKSILLKLTIEKEVEKTKFYSLLKDQGIDIPKLYGNVKINDTYFELQEFVEGEKFQIIELNDLFFLTNLSNIISRIKFEEISNNFSSIFSNIEDFNETTFWSRNLNDFLVVFESRKSITKKKLELIPKVLSHGDLSNLNIIRAKDKNFVIDFSIGFYSFLGYDIACYFYHNFENVSEILGSNFDEIIGIIFKNLFNDRIDSDIEIEEFVFIFYCMCINYGLGRISKKNNIKKEIEKERMDNFLNIWNVKSYIIER